MPATAGRVRMPANNCVHSSAALRTHGIWQSAIGYDPYAPNKEDTKKSARAQPQSSNPGPEGENAYASFQGLLALARITGSNADEARGSCKKCGRVGHLTFQCRNFLSIKDDKEKDQEAIQGAVNAGLEKLKGNGKKMSECSDESDEDESESSDSDYDSEIERVIAQKYGKKLKLSSNLKSSRRKKDDDSEDESDYEKKKKRGRSKKRSVKRDLSDSYDENSGGKKRRNDESSDEDDLDRRSRRRKSMKEKSRKSRKRCDSDSDISRSEDSRVGRDKRRSERRNRK